MSERVEEIRRRWFSVNPPGGTIAVEDIGVLLTALAQAEREREEWRQARAAQVNALHRLGLLGSPVEELERLVAEVERLKGDNRAIEADNDALVKSCQQAEAALARVRAALASVVKVHLTSRTP